MYKNGVSMLPQANVLCSFSLVLLRLCVIGRNGSKISQNQALCITEDCKCNVLLQMHIN